ncbi:MAG: YdcH family protein [Terracidiphilus sp.]
MAIPPKNPRLSRFCPAFPLANSPTSELFVNVREMMEGKMDENQNPLSEEIDRLHAEHRRYAQRLDQLIQKPYLSDDEQLEEVRLKKLKLHAKDLIYALERRQAVVA